MHDPAPTCLIAGRAEPPAGPVLGERTDPNTGARRHEVAAASADQVERAVAAAHALHASRAWAEATPAERAAQLAPLAALLAAHADDLVLGEALDTGVPTAWWHTTIPGLAGAYAVVAEIAEAAGLHAQHDGYVGRVDQHRLPWGPALVLAPFNAPLLIAAGKAVNALAVGCPVIIKPSERTPTGASSLAALIAEAGLPEGLLQVVHGGAETAQALVGDRRVAAVSYTGGTAGGIAVARTCAEQLKPADLELSGNGPVVVTADVDVAATARELVAGMTTLNGQWCAAPRRVIAERPLLEPLREAVLDGLAQLRVGSSLDAGTTLGPMVDARHRDHLAGQLAALERAGAAVDRVGALPEGEGSFLLPAVVTGVGPEPLREEVFGPVLSMQPFDAPEEALALADDAPQGLVAYVFSGEEGRARDLGRRLRAGQVKIGGTSVVGPSAEGEGDMWGSSGVGTFGPAGARFFTGARHVGPTPTVDQSPL